MPACGISRSHSVMGNFGVACGETGTEMVLPSLDCSFSGVTSVAVRRDELETNVIFFERLFEFLRAFVVKNVEFRGIAMHLEPGVEAGPGVGEVASLMGLERLGEDGVTVIIVENHHIIITSRRLYREFSGLVRVGFVEVGCVEHRCKHGMGTFIGRLLGQANV
jgi:hypothetical protein